MSNWKIDLLCQHSQTSSLLILENSSDDIFSVINYKLLKSVKIYRKPINISQKRFKFGPILDLICSLSLTSSFVNLRKFKWWQKYFFKQVLGEISAPFSQYKTWHFALGEWIVKNLQAQNLASPLFFTHLSPFETDISSSKGSKKPEMLSKSKMPYSLEI